jgi:hypothetical protein
MTASDVESEPGKGTSFAVYLPEGKSHFEEDDCTWDETPDADDKEKGRENISDLMLLPEAEGNGSHSHSAAHGQG